MDCYLLAALEKRDQINHELIQIDREPLCLTSIKRLNEVYQHISSLGAI
jgi:hypothetical protein